MNDNPAKSRQNPEKPDTAPNSDAPLWLLQKDDTRFLYLSLFLSITVHIILFAVMAATHIFHPFTGTTQEFDLVWFSPAGMMVPLKPTTNKSSYLKNAPDKIARNAPGAKPRPAISPPVNTVSAPPPAAKKTTPPAINLPQTSPAPAETQTTKETPTEEPAELTISRFSGKVVEVVNKKTENPAFHVISSVKMKSKNAQSVVQSIRETEVEPVNQPKNGINSKKSENKTATAQPTKEPTVKKAEKVATVTASTNQPKVSQKTVRENAIQRKVSSAAVAAADNKTATLPAVNRSINSFAAALDTLSAVGNKPTAQTQAPQKPLNGLAGSAQQPSSLKSPAEPKTAARPPTVEKAAPAEEKQAPPPPPPPQLVLHPPVAGDLKLVITGDIDLKVEVFFKAFPKTRRSKPFTRREAENRRNIIPKLVRTRENVHEAVVEVTEEGIYSIMVRCNNGKPGTAGLTLKIRESRPGAKSKDLGSRKIDDLVEVAKILMPEGVLWNDDSYFTGDMEDADSITKFNSGTELMWREYK